MPPGFYNPYDQQVYDAGFKYIPQSKYLLNPFKIPTDDSTTTPPDTGGITSLNRGGGDGDFNPYNTDMSKVRQDYNAFPSRQAGEIYSKTFNPGLNPYENNMSQSLGPVIQAQSRYNLANQNVSRTGPMTPERRAEIMKDADNIIQDNRMRYATEGQYIDPYDPVYSSMTEAQKFMDNYPEYYGVPSGVPEPGIPAAIGRYMSNSLLGKGFGIAKDFLGRVLPINERAIMENEARGAGIFTDDIGRIVTDDYNTAGGIMAGYNLNKIDEGTFDKRRGTIENTLGSKYGLSASQIEAAKNNPNYKGPGANLIERLGLLDESEEDIFDARKKTKQVYKMRKDKKDADKKRRQEEKAAAAAAKAAAAAAAKAEADRAAQYGKTNYGQGSDGQQSYSGDAIGAGNLGFGVGATTGGPVSNKTGRGRTDYMNGGLADMLEIYD